MTCAACNRPMDDKDAMGLHRWDGMRLLGVVWVHADESACANPARRRELMEGV